MFSCWSEPRSTNLVQIILEHTFSPHFTLCQAGSTWLPQKVTTSLLKWYVIWHKSYQEYITFTNANTFYLPEFLQALHFFPITAYPWFLAIHCPTELKPKFIISKWSNKNNGFWSYSLSVTKPTSLVIKEKITIHFNRHKVGLS